MEMLKSYRIWCRSNSTFLFPGIFSYQCFFAVPFHYHYQGSSAVWVHSSLVLQTLTDPKYLGRILALEYQLTTLFEVTGYFLKTSMTLVVGFSDHQLALVVAGLGLGVELFWGFYHSLSLGAARPKFNNNEGGKGIDQGLA